MMWNGEGSWAWSWLAVPLMVVLVLMTGRMMLGRGHRHCADSGDTGDPAGRRSGGAERILAEQLARGDIDIDDYELRLGALPTTSPPDRT